MPMESWIFFFFNFFFGIGRVWSLNYIYKALQKMWLPLNHILWVSANSTGKVSDG